MPNPRSEQDAATDQTRRDNELVLVDDLSKDDPLCDRTVQEILQLTLIPEDKILDVLTIPLIRGKTILCENPASFEELRAAFDFKHDTKLKPSSSLFRSFTNNFQPEENMELQQVFAEVPVWSRENFGDQKGLEHKAPLFGIFEEFGELMIAIEEDGSTDNIHDAIGDIGIYSIDFLSRVGIDPVEVWPAVTDVGHQYKHTAYPYLSKVGHAVLKNHQGIRGFDDQSKFLLEVKVNMALFLGRLNNHYDITKHTITTWENNVRKRNWKKNPEGQNV